MHAISIAEDVLRKGCPHIHKARLENLSDVVRGTPPPQARGSALGQSRIAKAKAASDSLLWRAGTQRQAAGEGGAESTNGFSAASRN